MRFHILGLSHTQTTREYSCCAFTQKVRLLCKMLYGLGHTVFHYGVEGSDPVCTETIPVLSLADFERDHGKDFRVHGFNLSLDTSAYRHFTANSIDEIKARLEPLDFLLCPFGIAHKPQADVLAGKVITVESGIGYDYTFAQHRVFESYAWMHFTYGKEGRGLSPVFYDAVIPNYLDMDDYPFYPVKKDYAILVARQTPLKGVQIASDVCEKIGLPLYVAGQGDIPGVKARRLGVLSIEERAKWVGEAKVLFMPTQYIEPFGTVHAEAMAYGTPVITTDFGVFPETVIHGVTGYRCRTFEQFVWAAKNIDRIDPLDCRNHALNHFSLPRVARMYDEYFTTLFRLYTDPKGWYAENPERRELDWLKPEEFLER